MARLEGKVALITGAARGQGAEEARLFAREGARVVLADLLDEEGKRVEAEIREAGGDALYIHLDVTREADWIAAFDRVIQHYGQLNILVNNAGIILRQGIEETTEAQWEQIMAVNGKGAFLGIKHAIPHMRRAGGGSIVNISSTAGLVGSPRSSAVYAASKGAVRLMTKSTAVQHGKDNIRCNSVHPGCIDTPMFQEAMTDASRSLAGISQLPLGRVGTPLDVAYGVLYLASDESAFVTGTELVIDGGTTAR